jgi:hypothetical protein
MIPMEPVDLNSMVTNPHGLKELDIKENPRDDRSFLDRNHWPSPSRGGISR